MPFQFEKTNKASHVDIAGSEMVREFLNACEYARIPSEEEGKALGREFSQILDLTQFAQCLPRRIMATDGSWYAASLNEELMPTTRFGFVKVSALLIDLEAFDGLTVPGTELVDPFRLSTLQDLNNALVLPFPGSNVRWGGCLTVRDAFRKALDAHFLGPQTRFVDDDPATSLRATLFHIFSLSTQGDETRPGVITLHACPSCGDENVPVHDLLEEQLCPACQKPVYPTDVLRVWEAVAEDGTTNEAIGRVMSLVEHLLPVHYIRDLRRTSTLENLAKLGVFIDGPLALFGNAAKLHSGIMRFYYRVNEQLRARDLRPMIVIGLQKTGQLVDAFNLIKRFVSDGSIRAVDDEFYERRIVDGVPAKGGDKEIGKGETMNYGQDFLFKSSTGKCFVFALPYPFERKKGLASTQVGEIFKHAKAEIKYYEATLPRALALLEKLETSLYPNALIPISLAHQFTAISLMPGGRVLNLLSEQALRARAPAAG